ncbi:MAG TPA: HmuY family protein [Hanamia sp.]|nr:HmuY family protein [Hanamia sp.]
MKTLKLSMLALAAVVIGLVSCTKDDVPNPAPTPAVSVTDSIEIPFATNNFTLYSFKDSAVVSNNDSATTKWDIGIRLVSIIVNSHASGPGNAGVITQSGIYDAFKIAPENGYAYDTTTSKTAIDAGFTTGWYNYDDATHAFSPKAGKFFVIRTADNHYVKMEILSVSYKDFVGPVPVTLIYKFRYSYQADGSRNF